LIVSAALADTYNIQRLFEEDVRTSDEEKNKTRNKTRRKEKKEEKKKEQKKEKRMKRKKLTFWFPS
jgi:hypothetical protein